MARHQRDALATQKIQETRSERQLANEMRMKLAMSFLSPLSGLIRVGYQQAADGLPMTPFNIALSHHKKYAIGGEYPDLYFDYSKAIISTGSIAPAEALAAAWAEDGLAISWHTSPQDGNLVNEQNTTILLCLATNDKWDIRTSGITRGMGQYLFPLPQNVIGVDVHVYLAFNIALSSEMSESRYVHVHAIKQRDNN